MPHPPIVLPIFIDELVLHKREKKNDVRWNNKKSRISLPQNAIIVDILFPTIRIINTTTAIGIISNKHKRSESTKSF